MSFAPQSLLDVRRYLSDQTGKKPLNFSIRSAKSARGYHAGKAEIFGPNGQGWKDYSVKDPRDKAGLSNASSAIDIRLPVKTLKLLVAYLVAGARSGDLDIMEVIGPDANGKANYWSKATGWQSRPKLAPASHEWHIHMAFPRDTEFGDRVAIFVPFFEDAVPVPVEPEADPEDAGSPELTGPDVEALEAENIDLKARIETAKAALG